MLDELEPWELARWRAARETIPLDDGWRQTDTICGAIQNEFAQHFAIKAGKKTIPKSWLYKLGSYIPKIRSKKRDKPKVNQASIDITQALIESQFLG